MLKVENARLPVGKSVVLALTCIGLSVASAVHANDEPTVNLGLTSFFDGALPSGPGLYYQNYVEYYTTGRFNDAQGNALGPPKQSLDIIADINQFTYYFRGTVGPGRLAIDVVIPTVALANVQDGRGGAVLQARTGLGDIFFAPIYQFEPIKGPWHTTLLQSFEFDVLAPTGAYDRRIAINPGNNAWGIDPFYSFTFLPIPKLSLTSRIHYLYNFANSAPEAAFGQTAHEIRAGQAFHVNFSAGYAVTRKFTAGLNGYYFIQTTDTQINDVDAPGRRERVLGVGPGIFYTMSKDTFIVANAYVETEVRNKTQGDRFVFRLVHHF
jgi:hypothetical protein